MDISTTINIVLTSIIVISTVTNAYCVLRMSQFAEEQYRLHKTVYIVRKNRHFCEAIRIESIIGFDNQKYQNSFFLYINNKDLRDYRIELRNNEDSPEKYFFDIINAKVEKIYTV